MKIAIVTSGGDCPGMNSFILEMAKALRGTRDELNGFIGGYNGILTNERMDLSFQNLSSLAIGKKGGSILLTGRLPTLKQETVQEELKKKLMEYEIDWLLVVGGDGSFKAASILNRLGINVIGIPATIDNNIPGTDFTLGFDTAINKTVVHLNDIEDTATAMPGKMYLIETLGGDCGNIARAAFDEGVCDLCITPEAPYQDEEMLKRIEGLFDQGNQYVTVTICEGVGKTLYYESLFKEKLNRKVHISIIGHQQRGGSPTAFDRHLAKGFAQEVILLIKRGQSGRMVSFKDGTFCSVALQR